jgi:two-component sensor histidine kinase
VRLAVAVEGGRFRLDWREEGGPPAELGDHRGFGRVLLEELVPRQLGGEARLEGGPSGLRYALDAPAEGALAEAA